MPTDRNKETVRRIYEDCINPGRWELIPELVDASYVGPTGERGPEGFQKTVAGVRNGVPDIRFTIHELIAEGDRVAVRWMWAGTHTGTLLGYAPSGKSVTNTGIAIYTLRDGKIVAASLITDRLGFLQQIGVVPTR